MTVLTASARTAARVDFVSLSLAASIACLPLTWVHLVGLGGFDLTVPYAMSIVLGFVLLAVLPRALDAALHFASVGGVWLAAYGLYLIILAMHLAGMPDKGLLTRQVFFLLCATLFATSLILTRGAPGPLRIGGLGALLGFIAVSEVVAWSIGLSWLVAVERFVVQGDFEFLIYQFFRGIFQEASGSIEEVPAALKNAVSAGIFVSLIVFRIGHTSDRPDRVGQIMTCLVLVILLMLSTRSVLLVTLVALPIAFGIATARRPRLNVNGLIASGIVVLIGVCGVGLVLSSLDAATTVLEDRFSFGDASVNGRLEQFSFALSGIERSVFVGSGLEEINGQLVHNLFLGAWLHGGLGAFLLILTAYLLLVGAWIRTVAVFTLTPSSWVLPIRVEWVAVLPVLAFFRVWVGGDAGHPGYPEWLSIFGFFALVTTNSLAKRRKRSLTPRASLGLVRP